MRRLIALLTCLAVTLPVAATAATPLPVQDLVAERARDSFGPELPEEGRFDITLRSDQQGAEAVMLSAFWMDRATGQFLANAVGADGRVTRLQGLAVLTVTVPVPVRRMLPGERLGEGDIAMIDMPHARLGAYAVTDPAKLLGKEVRRVLARGRPVMAQSVMEPLVIDRGDKVAIHYDDGKLALSAPGRALDDAHRGQELRIVNLVSNSLVTAVARGEGQVEIVR